MRLLNIYRETISDGLGLRYSIYIAGCPHACLGCHNPDSWNAEGGVYLTEQMLMDIIEEIKCNPLLDGITISGGDPFLNPSDLLWLVRTLKEHTHKNIWCYTGYTIEYLLSREDYKAPLYYIDVLVDGPFIRDLYDPNLRFRGSRNQRIIDNPLTYQVGLTK